MEATSVEAMEIEITLDDLELQAAKQLLVELKMIKKRIYDSGTLINGILVIQIKGVLKGLIYKYNSYGLLMGENITLSLSSYSKHANMDFVYSPKLQQLMQLVVSDNLERTRNQIKQEGVA